MPADAFEPAGATKPATAEIPLTGTSFAERAPAIMQRLQRDFGLTDVQAAGILGNLGHESAGFQQLQEIRPVNGGLGGLGWAQWTGPRRRTFEAWCQQHKLDPHADEANYGYLKCELETTERGAIVAVRQAHTVAAATAAFEAHFERADPRYVNYSSRNGYALRALSAYLAATAKAKTIQPSHASTT